MATASPTSPTPYVCDLPGWGADGRSTGAAVQAVVSTATGVNADGRNTAKLAAAVEFGTRGWPQNSPETPHKVTPDISFYREVYGNGKLQMPDGTILRHWGFMDEKGTKTIPSPVIRVCEGQIVHVTLKSTKGPHTIHHHGIEPDAHNDGVGHTSFDVGNQYTYQWRPSESGTFFYHCHVNTPLHVQLGLFGGLIVDPEGGPGQLWKGGPHYDHERFWVGMAMDPTWANLDHHAGVDGANVGLNRLDPQYFLINGKASDTDVECRCSDGRPFDRGYDVRSMTLAPAERYDMLMRPRRPGVHRVRVETLHWITGKVLGYAETLITVTGDALADPPGATHPEPDYGYAYDAPAPSPAPGGQAPAGPPADLYAPVDPYAQPAPAAAAAPAPAAPQTRVLGSKTRSTRKLTLKERLRLKEKARARKRAEVQRKAEAKLKAKAKRKAVKATKRPSAKAKKEGSSAKTGRRGSPRQR
jgi:hypothetical protein